ncbi:MAG: hypothetical protein GY870_02880 [archaeon]|nr:hypothetical protein [archaeon]
MKLKKNKKKNKKLSILLLTIFLSLFIASTISVIPDRRNDLNLSIAENNEQIPSSSGISDILGFWETEKSRVESIELNSTNVWRNTTEIQNIGGKKYNKTEVSYAVPHFVDNEMATFRINATIFSPTNESKTMEKMPGVAMWTGAGGKREQYFDSARFLVDLNMTVLVAGHPGWDNNEGPKNDNNTRYHTGPFNKTSHIYATICAALQGVRVLGNQSCVNSSQLVVTGTSYGGLTSQFVGAIYSDNISLVLPLIAVGSFEESTVEGVLFHRGMMIDDFLDWSATTENEIDPVYYLEKSDYPDICWAVGTDDDFFNYRGINVTYNTVISPNDKWLQIHPNGHHFGDPGFYSDTHLYLLNYTFFGGSAPPAIKVNQGNTITNFLGDQYNISVTVEGEAEIDYVEVSYQYLNVFGDPWRFQNLSKIAEGSNIWTGMINPAWLTSETEYLIIVHLKNGGDVWFTSQIYSASVLRNNLSILNIIGLVALILIPIAFLLKKKYDKEVLKRDIEDKKNTQNKKEFLIEILILAGSEAAIFASLVMPYMVWTWPITWSQLYLMENLFNATYLFKNISYFFTPVFFGFLALCGIISIKKPIISGFLNTLYPMFCILLPIVVGQPFGADLAPVVGYGAYLFLFGALIQIAIGFFKIMKRKKEKKQINR